MQDFKATTLAYLPIAKVRKLDTRQIRDIQIRLTDYIETYPHFSREFKRLQRACSKVLSQRHHDRQITIAFE